MKAEIVAHIFMMESTSFRQGQRYCSFL